MRTCYVCLEQDSNEKGSVDQYTSGEVDGEHYEGGDYHGECAFEIGMPEMLMV